MTSKYDLIVIGGGLNALVCATYARKRALKVLVLEQIDRLGGLGAGYEFHPGFRAPGVLHDTSALRPWVVDDLGLTRHGLKWRKDAAPIFAPAIEGRGLLLWRDPRQAHEELAPLGVEEAKGYADLRAFFDRVAPFVRRVFDDLAPDVVATSLPATWDLAKKVLALRLLGKADMMELLRIPPMCVADWLNEYFANDLLKATLAQPSLWCSLTGPWSPGTAANLLMHETLAGPGVVGGPAAVVAAALAVAQAAGVETRTNAKVVRIEIQGSRVKGVTLSTGEHLDAPVVASAIDPRTLFLSLVPSHHLSMGFRHDARAIRARGTTAKVHLALSAYPEFTSRPSTKAEFIRVGTTFDGLERAFDALKYRRMSEEPMLDIYVPSAEAPGYAPQGQHVMSIMVHCAPHDLAGGWSRESKERLLEVVMSTLARYAPSLPGLVLGKEVLTPADIEARFGLAGGHLYHVEHAADQLFARPMAACSRYETPLAGLYLCGAGAHPGGGITGAPGALAARVICG